jgi:hypothetical protein
MMYAKYAFAAVMAAVAVNAEVDMPAGSCDSCGSSCGAHSSSCRSFGVPSCGMACCDSSCVSDKAVFDKDFPTAELKVFYVAEGTSINGTNYTAEMMPAIPAPEGQEGAEATPFKFASGTGAFKIADKVESGAAPEVAEGQEAPPAGVALAAGDIVVGWKGDSSSYLLSAPKDATDLVTLIKADKVKGFLVLPSKDAPAPASSGVTHADETGDKPADTDAAAPVDGTEGTNPEEPPKEKSSMTWVFVAVGIVVVLAVIGVVVYFVMAGGDDTEEEETDEEETGAEEA